MKLTNEEKSILTLALEQLEKFYDEKEDVCRQFKWICHNYLPQGGEGYVANLNVFEIQDKTIADIRKSKEEARKIIMKITNS